MDTASTGAIIKDVVTILGALIGTGLGIYNFCKARKSELKKTAEETEDWEFYLHLNEVQSKNPLPLSHTPPLGSTEHRIFERLANRGLVKKFRSPEGVSFVLQNTGNS